MSKPPLRVVPELVAPRRVDKGVVGTLIVVALAGLLAATARTHQDASPWGASIRDATAVGVSGSASAPGGTDYFPAGYRLNASEPTPHIETF